MNKCIHARGRMYRAGRNVFLNLLLRTLPKPIADILKKWAAEKRQAEVWICTEE